MQLLRKSHMKPFFLYNNDGRCFRNLLPGKCSIQVKSVVIF